MLPLPGRWEVAELAGQELTVDLVRIGQPEVRVDPAADRLEPARAKRLDRVGVAVEEDDRLLVVGNAVGWVLDGPNEVAVAVESDVLRLVDGADLDDLPAEVLETRPLVVRKAAARVSPWSGLRSTWSAGMRIASFRISTASGR